MPCLNIQTEEVEDEEFPQTIVEDDLSEESYNDESNYQDSSDEELNEEAVRRESEEEIDIDEGTAPTIKNQTKDLQSTRGLL